jgi:large subunit ribosomal protein L30
MAANPGRTLKVTLVRSPIGTKQPHRACVRGMGLTRLNQTVVLPDTPETRGMIARVAYLVKFEQ